eukprot:352908-Chlamydomonas_euryale.AAC.10
MVGRLAGWSVRWMAVWLVSWLASGLVHWRRRVAMKRERRQWSKSKGNGAGTRKGDALRLALGFEKGCRG